MPPRPPRRITPPLPQRQGIDPVCLILPEHPLKELRAASAARSAGTDLVGHTEPKTIAQFLTARFYPHAPHIIAERFARQEVRTDTGQVLHPGSPYTPRLRIWYYRELPDEPQLPNDLPVLYEDEHVLAVDKPHFLPTTPRGSFVAQTALTMLRVRETNPLLVPVHRLDRATAGVVLFAKTVQARAPFQLMFQNRQVAKEYLAVAPPLPQDQAPGGVYDGSTGLTVRTRIEKLRHTLQVRQLDSASCARQSLAVNAITDVHLLATFGAPPLGTDTPTANGALPYPAPGEPLGLYRLRPATGKTHQLRAHLNLLGAPIYGDVLYPRVLPAAPDDAGLPLQLLAQQLQFTHPVTGTAVCVRSARMLLLAPS